MDRVNHDSYEQQVKLWIVRDLERDGHIVLPTLIGQGLASRQSPPLTLQTEWHKTHLIGVVLGWNGDLVDRYGANGMVSWINNYDPLSYVIPGRNYNGLLQW